MPFLLSCRLVIWSSWSFQSIVWSIRIYLLSQWNVYYLILIFFLIVNIISLIGMFIRQSRCYTPLVKQKSFRKILENVISTSEDLMFCITVLLYRFRYLNNNLINTIQQGTFKDLLSLVKLYVQIKEFIVFVLLSL